MAPASGVSPLLRHTPTRVYLRRLVVGVVVMLLAAYLAISALAAAVLTVPQRRFVVESNGGWSYTQTPSAFNLPYEDISFPAREDRVRINAWYIPGADREQVIVVVHGKDGCRPCEFQNRALHFARAMHERGFTLLLMDLRGHGESGGARVTFGLHERYDIQGAADWLLAQGVKPGRIGVLGVSMGAASSIFATAEEPAIGALVADSSYADIAPILRREFPRGSGLPGIFLPSSLLMGRLISGARLADARPVDVIGRIAPRPLLIAHSSDDPLIPTRDAERLAAAAPGSELWIVPGVSHARSYAYNPSAYVDRVARFFKGALR